MRSRSAIPRAAAAATYFVRLLERLGIAEAMKPKLRPGTNMQAAVARGEVEMTVNGIVPILRAPGIELVGPLPPELQSYSPFFAGVSAATREKDAAMALLKHLTSPESIAVFKQRGVEPMPTDKSELVRRCESPTTPATHSPLTKLYGFVPNKPC